MFMFRRKRTNLIKRLLKARISGADESGQRHETQGEIEDPSTWTSAAASASPASPTATTASTIECETVIRNMLLKKLEVPQLELLCAAVESKGEDLSDCVLISREFEDYSSSASRTVVGGVAVHMLCCQMWRWSDLRHADELKRLPMCGSQNDPVYMCCNPYHWSRLCEPESPPPPYSRFAMENLKPEDRAPSEIPFFCRDRYVESVTTSGEGNNYNSSFPNNSGEWCRLAYWELTQRVGNQFPVREPAISVFENELRGNGLSLATLQNGNHTPSDSVRRTRAKIGHGVILSQESDGVWVYNISTQPIFVNSPTITADMLYNNNANNLLSPPNPSLCVYRVPAGHCLCIHDPYRINSDWHENLDYQMPPTGPVDPNSIRISFVKGWGQNYSRQEITACPCWLEVLLAPCR